ncbi:hypothetical protein C9374_001978 [Naegleria lovaniensis]|uniref:RING-type E3 ubiquitin transferase (cysteine targeting) n=1 Tax=Naegleria lovaniensis TaxID=51637 RepID=A0AA88GV87_NAELO|nr:Peroxin 2 (Pex2), putative [Naegleria lovaniensis]KAG2386943.1 hypothetical protein C9374_001978 [Naegleria lovaniensis]
MLFIRIFIYKYSIYDNNQTFGDRIQNLKYSNTEMKDPNIFSKYLYGIASIGIPYLYERVCKSQYLNIEYLKRFEYYYKTLEFINFIIFLYQGKYKSLIDRIFHWRKVYATRFMIRQLSFDYMNTELIWNGLAETILFIAPLINFKKLLTFLNRVWDWMTSRMRKDLRMWIENISQHETLKKDMNSTSLNTIHDTTITGTTSTLQSSSSLTMINNNSSEYYSNQECPFCNANPILIPYVSHDGACKHRFCYYCIENALLNDSSDHCVNCPSCSKEITKSKRFYR